MSKKKYILLEVTHPIIRVLIAAALLFAFSLKGLAWPIGEIISIGKPPSQYEVSSSIGAGGLSDVYRGYDLKTGETVVLKKVKKSYLFHSVVSPALRRGRKFISSPKSESFAKILHVGTFYSRNGDYTRGYVEEYLEGETLEKFAMNNFQYDQSLEQKMTAIKKLYEIVVQLNSGVAHAAKNGWVIGDIKGANIFIEDVSSTKPKVKFFDYDSLNRSSRASPAGIYTEGYQAPEVERFFDNAQPLSDIYSIGRTIQWVIKNHIDLNGFLYELPQDGRNMVQRLREFSEAATEAKVKNRFEQLSLFSLSHPELLSKEQLEQLKPRSMPRRILRSFTIPMQACAITYRVVKSIMLDGLKTNP